MNYDEMPAGKEMDILIRSVVLEDNRNWHEKEKFHDQSHGDSSCGGCTDWVPAYSTSISAAWEVVEKLISLHPNVCWEDGEWQCYLDDHNKGYGELFVGYADTAPLAICRAALKAVEK